MAQVIQDRNRQEIRQAIGYNAGCLKVGEATSNGDTTSLIDAKTFAPFADDGINGNQIMMRAGTAGNIGQTTFVADFADSGEDATLYPALPSSTADGDTFEMWSNGVTIEQVNEMINEAMIEVTNECLQDKTDVSFYTEWDIDEDTIPTGFVAIHTVEYVNDLGDTALIDTCDTLWTAGDSNTTVSLDTEQMRTGGACNKFTVGAGLGINSLIATKAITATNMSNWDTIEFSFRSSITLTSGQLTFCMDDTALCASPIEAIDIPAITANTWTRVLLTMGYPNLDTAIISIGIKQVADVGACLLWIDDVWGLKAQSRKYRMLHPHWWDIVGGTTKYLKLTPEAKAIIGSPTLLRLKGYQKASLLSDDTTDSTIDPDYIIAAVTGRLLMSEAITPGLDTKGRMSRAQYWLDQAERKRLLISTNLAAGTRFIQYDKSIIK